MSTPSEHFDAVIVGSGFGGSIMAERLTDAGKRVCVLERGRPWPPGDFPRSPHAFRRAFWDPSAGLYGMYTYLGAGLVAIHFAPGQIAKAIFVYGCGAIVGALIGGRLADWPSTGTRADQWPIAPGGGPGQTSAAKSRRTNRPPSSIRALMYASPGRNSRSVA